MLDLPESLKALFTWVKIIITLFAHFSILAVSFLLQSWNYTGQSLFKRQI